jgi:hypothetical protein
VVVAPPYTTTSTNVTFYYNATATDQASAEAACALSGGHLAAYTSAQEQNEVEQFYISQGYILPTFHKGYWIGLQVRPLRAHPGLGTLCLTGCKCLPAYNPHPTPPHPTPPHPTPPHPAGANVGRGQVPVDRPQHQGSQPQHVQGLGHLPRRFHQARA